MLALRQSLACWRCQVRATVAQLLGHPFQYCATCREQIRLAQSGWNEWGQTVAGASRNEPSSPPETGGASAPSIARVAPPPKLAADVRQADTRRTDTVEWRG